jgi:hypothetical protein
VWTAVGGGLAVVAVSVGVGVALGRPGWNNYGDVGPGSVRGALSVHW